MIINTIRSLLLLLSLSLLLKMNGEDTRGIVGKSVWNSTCRSLEEKVAPIIFVIFKTAHIYKWVDAMQCRMYQKEGHWVSKQVTVWFISFTAQLSLLWLPECPIKDRHWCKRPNFWRSTILHNCFSALKDLSLWESVHPWSNQSHQYSTSCLCTFPEFSVFGTFCCLFSVWDTFSIINHFCWKGQIHFEKMEKQ